MRACVCVVRVCVCACVCIHVCICNTHCDLLAGLSTYCMYRPEGMQKWKVSMCNMYHESCEFHVMRTLASCDYVDKNSTIK